MPDPDFSMLTEAKTQMLVQAKRLIADLPDDMLRGEWRWYWNGIGRHDESASMYGLDLKTWIELVFAEMLKRGLQET